jgi:hypothetical protein
MAFGTILPRSRRKSSGDTSPQEVIRGVYELAPEAVITSMLDVVVDTSGSEGLDALARRVQEKKRERES